MASSGWKEKENDMGVKEAIETLDRFCASQDHWCGNCPIGSKGSSEWLDWGCPIGALIDDTTIMRALEDI